VQFSKAARYRRHDWITFRAFGNTSDPRDVAITDRRQNASLPTDAPLDLLCDVCQPVEGRCRVSACATSASFISICIRMAYSVCGSSGCGGARNIDAGSLKHRPHRPGRAYPLGLADAW
jgi:hypothetical protein